MELTEDTWRALARSSPWRWRTLHFTRTDEDGTFEAWVRRPGQMLVRDAKGRTTDHSDLPRSGLLSRRSLTTVMLSDGSPSTAEPDPASWQPRFPHDVRPTLRADGLVAARPDAFFIEYDDPMYNSYDWVAMLDPVELTHHTRVTNLRAEHANGRLVWRAVVNAEEGYDPRCSCCPLLWSEVSDRQEHEESGVPFVASKHYPNGYEVALDLRTGVVADIRPVGGEGASLWFSLDIKDVDVPMDDLFARR